MNVPSGPPAENPEGRNPRFPPPTSPRFPELREIPTGDIGIEAIRERAIKKAALVFGEGNPKVIKTSKLSYKQAVESQPESGFGELSNPEVPVYLVEVEGTFKPRTFRPRVRNGRLEPSPIPTFKKGYFIIRAADGVSIQTQLSNK